MAVSGLFFFLFSIFFFIFIYLLSHLTFLTLRYSMKGYNESDAVVASKGVVTFIRSVYFTNVLEIFLLKLW